MMEVMISLSLENDRIKGHSHRMLFELNKRFMAVACKTQALETHFSRVELFKCSCNAHFCVMLETLQKM